MRITINRLYKESIFCADFNSLITNNEIIFEKNKVAIVYGPNGTGKTSLAKVLAKEQGTEYDIEIDGIKNTQNNPVFAHIISDQNDRNIIQGSTEDFILGDNIRREYELKNKIELIFKDIFESKLSIQLKSKFGISTKQSQFDEIFSDKALLQYISDLANSKSKGKGIDKKAFIDFFSGKSLSKITPPDEEKFKFFVEDYKEKDSAIRIFLNQIFSLDEEEKILLKIEENAEAINILKKFHYVQECIVCDHKINPVEVLTKKKSQYKKSNESLSKRTQKIMSEILNKLPATDPFGIAEKLRSALLSGNSDVLSEVKTEIDKCIKAYPALVLDSFIDTVTESKIIETYKDYENINKEKPKFENEDVIFIEKFLNDCLDRKISLIRDPDNNLRLLLGNDEFLNQDRKQLLLSNGEQNFLSLAFELLKAQKVSQEVVVLDDPISSFDSIYKNKIAYAILKLLSEKNTIILTHNTDLIKLLEHQRQNCFKLYYLNNTLGEENGFIFVNENEAQILLYVPKFLELLRGPIKSEIVDELTFLISITPFLRGCAQIFNMQEEKDLLTKVMHGYQDEKVNLSQVYQKVIGDGIIETDHEVSAEDITKLSCDNPISIKRDNYPLLHKTLAHTFTYLFLRLNTEKILVSKFRINTKKYDMLSNIITKAFQNGDENSVNNRVFFLSRKTLLNEFNHFEMDMNIFQPAIDITNQALAKEKQQILSRLGEL